MVILPARGQDAAPSFVPPNRGGDKSEPYVRLFKHEAAYVQLVVTAARTVRPLTQRAHQDRPVPARRLLGIAGEIGRL